MRIDHDLVSVAAAGLSGGLLGGGLMSLHVEGGTQVQVPRSIMKAFLEQDPNHPGLETVRLPTAGCGGADENTPPPQHCREVESELCLVCRRCGRAYPQESTLLAHQRSCYMGHQQRRGALRVIQARYACSLCEPGVPARTYGTVNEWRRHAETLQHRARLEAAQERQQHQQQQQQFEGSAQSGEETNPLTDEMEDVVNQITLLAARAAAESTTGQPRETSQERAGQDNNNGPDAKRQKLVQEVAAFAGAR